MVKSVEDVQSFMSDSQNNNMVRKHNAWKYQLVWPRDSEKGKESPGIIGRLKSVLTNTGPDIFVVKKHNRRPISVEEWTNWGGYHIKNAQSEESRRGSFHRGAKHRGTRRYDPYTRKYVHFSPSQNWEDSTGRYPVLTAKEARQIGRQQASGARGPLEEMKDWDEWGPMRFQPEYDWFWRKAHRAGENRRLRRDPGSTPDPDFNFHERWPDGLRQMYPHVPRSPPHHRGFYDTSDDYYYRDYV